MTDPLAESIARMNAANTACYRRAVPAVMQPPVEDGYDVAELMAEALHRANCANVVFYAAAMPLAAALFVVGLLNLVRS
jgi:hypothetical protein